MKITYEWRNGKPWAVMSTPKMAKRQPLPVPLPASPHIAAQPAEWPSLCSPPVELPQPKANLPAACPSPASDMQPLLLQRQSPPCQQQPEQQVRPQQPQQQASRKARNTFSTLQILGSLLSAPEVPDCQPGLASTTMSLAVQSLRQRVACTTVWQQWGLDIDSIERYPLFCDHISVSFSLFCDHMPLQA